MKKVILSCCFLLLTVFSPFTASSITWEDGRLSLDYSIDVYYENVYGNVDKSSLDVDSEHKDNWHYSENLKVRMDKKVTDDLAIEFFAHVRNTSDKAVMNHRWKVLQAYLRLYGEDFELAIGDISEYYTKYTFNNTFLGAKVWYKPSPSFKFMALGGRNRDIHDDLYEHFLGGGRIEYTPRSEYLFGFSYIHTEVSKLYSGTSIADYSNDVWSFDTRLKLLDRKLQVKGEAAFSLYHEADPSLNLDGWALNIEADYRPIRELKLSLDYERVEPDFMTIMGTAARDRETIKTEFRYTPSRMWNLWGKYKFTRDDLTPESDADYRTYKHYSELGLVIRPFHDKDVYFKNLMLDMRLNYNDSMSNDFPRSVNEDTYEAKFLISNRYDKMRYSIEYRFRNTNDHTSDATDTIINTVGAKWGYGFYALGLDWDLKLGYKVDFKKTFEQNPDMALDSISHVSDASLGIFYEPTKTSLNVKYLGVITCADDAADTRRTSIKVALDQVLHETDSMKSTLGVSYENMDFWSTDHDDRYGENIYMLNFAVHF